MLEFRKLVCAATLFACGCTVSEAVDTTQPDAGVGNPPPVTGLAGSSGLLGLAGAPGFAGDTGSAGATTPTGSGGTGGVPSGGAGTPGGGAGMPGAAGAPAMTDAGTRMDARSDAGTSSDATVRLDGPSVDPTWTNIYNRFFNNASYASNCTGAPCHNPGKQKGLDFSSQMTGYTTVKAKLVVGAPNSSKVVSVLTSGSMPQARPKMPAADLAVIKAWIMAGALNN